MLKVLVLGATSNVGFAFLNACGKLFELHATAQSAGQFSLLPKHVHCHLFAVKRNDVTDLLKAVKPDVVINCVALASVDYCEAHKGECEAINLKFVEDLTLACKGSAVKFVHFSTSAIYGGETGHYNEQSMAKPVNYYGVCKLKADRFIEAHLSDYILLRPTTLIGTKMPFQRHNPLSFVAEALKNTQPLKLVDWDKVSFVWVDDLVKIMQQLILKGMTGVYNIGGDKALTRHEFGLLVRDSMHLKLEVEKCTYESLGLKAMRGANTSVDNSKIKNALNFEFTPLDKVVDFYLQSMA